MKTPKTCADRLSAPSQTHANHPPDRAVRNSSTSGCNDAFDMRDGVAMSSYIFRALGSPRTCISVLAQSFSFSSSC
jgi:hypothetical protein